MDPRVPLGAGDFRPGCSEAEVRTAVAVDLNVGGLAAGERVPGRGPDGTKKKVKRKQSLKCYVSWCNKLVLSNFKEF